MSKKRVARGKGAGIRQAPVHVPELVASSTVSPRRYLSHKQGGAAMVFSSRWSSDTMPPQPPPSSFQCYCYTCPLCMREEKRCCVCILYIYIYSFANYRRAMPTQFNLNFDARGGCLAGGSEIRNAHAHPPLNRPKLMRVIS